MSRRGGRRRPGILEGFTDGSGRSTVDGSVALALSKAFNMLLVVNSGDPEFFEAVRAEELDEPST
ncbi:hypothetical protein RRF57_009740 [Xylaria bambusicola]|uniref:Uncharacterized protein n=1 Tax=Xylaria bambusicola TaxID=326684 RepID=A0AAN7ZC62_9PEZI